MGTTPDPSSLVHLLAHQTMSAADYVTNGTEVFLKYLIAYSRTPMQIEKSVVKCLFNFGSRCTRHNIIMTRKQIQWKPSKADTIGTKILVRYSEVSLAQG